MPSYSCHMWIQNEFTKKVNHDASNNWDKCERTLERICDQEVLDKINTSFICFPSFDSFSAKLRLAKIVSCSAITSISVVYVNNAQFLEAVAIERNNFAAVIFFKGLEAVVTLQAQLRGNVSDHRGHADNALILLEGLTFPVPNSTVRSATEAQANFLPPEVTLMNIASSLGESWRYRFVECMWKWPQQPFWHSFYDAEAPTDEWDEIPEKSYTRSAEECSPSFWSYGTGSIPGWSFFTTNKKVQKTEWSGWNKDWDWSDWQTTTPTNDETSTQLPKGESTPKANNSEAQDTEPAQVNSPKCSSVSSINSSVANRIQDESEVDSEDDTEKPNSQ